MLVHIVVIAALTHLSVLLSVAAISKAISPSVFTRVLDKHGIVPKRATRVVTWTIILVEMVLGVWLISGVGFRWAAASTGLLLIAFVLYRVAVARFGPADTSCGCLGGLDEAEVIGVVLNCGVAFAVAGLGTGVSHYSTTSSALIAALWLMAIMVIVRQNRRVIARAYSAESIIEVAL